MARIGDGLDLDADLVAAAERASRRALEPLAGLSPDLVCAFVCGGAERDRAGVGERVAAVSGGATMIGCTAGGVIGAGRGVERRSGVSVWAASLPGLRVRSFHLEVLPAAAGATAVGLPERGDGDGVVVLLADPYSFPVNGFLASAGAAAPGLAVIGALGGEGSGPGSTGLWVDGRPVDRGAVGVLLDGDGPLPQTVVSAGCRPVGPAMTVTDAAGAVVAGLAGRPAMQKVEEVLAALPPVEQALASAGLYLGVARDEYADEHGCGDLLARSVVGLEPAGSGLVLESEVAVGTTVQLLVRDADSADADLQVRLGALRAVAPPTAGALLFSGAGRGADCFGPSLGGADHDVLGVRRGLGTEAVAGIFAAGELGSVAGRNWRHEFTATVLAFPS